MKKRSFFLLEVLIVLGLVVLFFTVMVNPRRMLAKEMKHIKELNYYHILENSFAEIRLLLMQREYAWDKIAQREKDAALIKRCSQDHYVDPITHEELHVYYRIWVEKEKQSFPYRLLHVDINVTQDKTGKKLKNQSFFIVVKKAE